MCDVRSDGGRGSDAAQSLAGTPEAGASGGGGSVSGGDGLRDLAAIRQCLERLCYELGRRGGMMEFEDYLDKVVYRNIHRGRTGPMET